MALKRISQVVIPLSGLELIIHVMPITLCHAVSVLRARLEPAHNSVIRSMRVSFLCVPGDHLSIFDAIHHNGKHVFHHAHIVTPFLCAAQENRCHAA